MTFERAKLNTFASLQIPFACAVFKACRTWLVGNKFYAASVFIHLTTHINYNNYNDLSSYSRNSLKFMLVIIAPPKKESMGQPKKLDIFRKN